MLVMVGPALSRRHAAGAESARGLLLTVLGELVLSTGGAAWTSAFIDVLGRLGVEEKAARQALMRTAADGWLASGRDGRRTRWALTPDGERLLTEGTDRIYGFTATMPDWDGRWLLVLARTPESDRPVRHLLRTRLSWAGLGSPAPGVWVSPHTSRAGEVGQVLAAAGLRDAHVFVGEHTGHGDAAALVGQSWDLAAVDAAYAAFRADFASASARDPLARLMELVHAWRRFPSLDPALPAALLPARWNGTQAAALFHRRHASWAPAATAAWSALNAGASPP
jgi:phenylacetic acid degradation operon negative regulatory protein